MHSSCYETCTNRSFVTDNTFQDFYSGAKTGAAGNPLLKLDNPAVVTELQAVIQFWLDKEPTPNLRMKIFVFKPSQQKVLPDLLKSF